MADAISVKEAALRWELTDRRVADMCKSGKIKGAYKRGRSWFIPADAERPPDSRVKSGAYRRKAAAGRLPLPIGISDYRVASMEYYYVDKTMLIKDFLDERPMVSLFTRPRRFGKTLNMDMLRTFFEKTDEDTSVYFRDKAIWKQGERYREQQGKYPVVFVTFKDVKCESWEETAEKLAEILGSEFARHSELLDSPRCNDVDKAYFRRIMERSASGVELSGAFLTLTKMLHEHHKVAPIIIIDEYDTPIQQGHMRGFYEQVILFMRNLFSGGFKDNRHLSFGFLTGILRVAKESIFSGLNNLTINSVLDNKYSEYFGFTPNEVKDMAAYYHAEDKFEDLRQWYDGYRFGQADIFNPWSVINYFRSDCRPGAYWQSTGNNEIIGDVLSEAGPDIYERLKSLLQGETILTYIDTGVIYPEIRSNPSSVYSFLLVAGYLKAVKSDTTFTDGFMCQVALPNREIAFVYKKEILDKLSHIVPQSTVISIQEAVYSGNAEELQKQMRKLLLQTASCFDTASETFYHGLVLGLCAMMDNRYYVSSNRESGEGRYDIQLMPKTKDMPGVLIELKAEKESSAERLKALAQDALEQIDERQYHTDMVTRGVETIYRYGVAFSGKAVEIAIGLPA
ncbi:MAG: AAA family ATPase [Oscillospiraceae bacterium]|nr:AAA family ATPase [Oscillospiraceae bacterium]